MSNGERERDENNKRNCGPEERKTNAGGGMEGKRIWGRKKEKRQPGRGNLFYNSTRMHPPLVESSSSCSGRSTHSFLSTLLLFAQGSLSLSFHFHATRMCEPFACSSVRSATCLVLRCSFILPFFPFLYSYRFECRFLAKSFLGSLLLGRSVGEARMI